LAVELFFGVDLFMVINSLPDTKKIFYSY
jgi:hypothetical protein